MKFSVGYQITDSDAFLNEILRFKDRIHEVYFSWGNYANGRNRQWMQKGMTPWEAQLRQLEDLKRLSQAGISLNLLFNAMCYGKDSQSRVFFEGIGETVDYLLSCTHLQSITTTSPLIAKFIKQNFPQLEVRASVNMEIGTVEGMDYISEYFDSYYLRRELNRNFKEIESLKTWCDENRKGLFALANSGCLNHCSAHVFHDNLVAHETEIAQMDNGYAFEGICAQYLKRPDKCIALIENTSFIRPEDVWRYEGIFPALKLATRVNADPVRVLRAYMNGSYHGSTLHLLEPNHTALLYPYLLDNKLLGSQVIDDKLCYTNFDQAMIRLEENLC